MTDTQGAFPRPGADIAAAALATAIGTDQKQSVGSVDVRDTAGQQAAKAWQHLLQLHAIIEGTCSRSCRLLVASLVHLGC